MTRLGALLTVLRHRVLPGRTAQSAAGTLLVRIAGAVAGLLASLAIARSLGATGLGIYSYSFAWVGLLAIPATLGLNELLVRQVATYQAHGESAKLKGVLRWTSIVVALVSTAIGLTAAYVIRATSLLPGLQATAMFIALTSLPLLALTALRQGALKGLRHVIAGQIAGVLVRPVALLILVLFGSTLLGRSADVLLVVLLAVFSVLASYIFGTLQLKGAIANLDSTVAPKYSQRDWLRQALPFLLIGGVLTINSRADIVMIGAIAGAHEAGIYTVAARGSEVIAFVLTAINAAIAPALAKAHAEGDAKRLEHLLRQSIRLASLLSTPVALAFICFGGHFLTIFGRGFAIGHLALAVLSVGRLVDAAAGSVGQVLNMTHHAGDTATAIGASAILNLVLNALLIPVWGLLGAAVATATSTAAYNVALAVLVYRRLGFYSILGLVNIRRPK